MNLRPPSGIATPSGHLEDVLARHQLWLESQGREGARAELPVCDLRGAGLRGRDLRQANLPMANFAGADLSRAKLCGANLLAANFRHALLCDADLNDFDARVGSQGEGQAAIPLSVPTVLDGADFGGADLTIAKFPRRSGFAELLQEKLSISRRARLYAVVLGLLLAFVSFQIAAARHERLLLPEPLTSDRALLDAATGKYGFLGAAIVAAIAYGIWVFVPLRKLCHPRNHLPARLPDGAAIDANRALWPLNMLAAHWMPLLREDRLNWRGRLPVWLTLAALFGMPPVVIVLVWWRFLAIHEWWSSAALAAFAALAIGASCFGWGKSAQAQRGVSESFRHNQAPVRKVRPAVRAAAAALLSANALIGISFAVIERGLAPYLAARAEIAFQNLSAYPQNVAEASIAALRGPNLAGRDLRYARISYSSLVNANLRGTRMDHSAITVSDLRRANLSGASLREASLFASNLESAALAGADLRGATLLCAVGLTGSQLASALTDEATILPDGSAGPFRFGSNAIVINPEECAHWAPGNPPPVEVEIPRQVLPPPATSPPSGQLSTRPQGEANADQSDQPAEPDLSPIEELKPSRKVPASEPKK